jgi:dipeptidyl aminopeptidase/acylaminoacyl peptidase
MQQGGEYLAEPKSNVWFDETSAGNWSAESGCHSCAYCREAALCAVRAEGRRWPRRKLADQPTDVTLGAAQGQSRIRIDRRRWADAGWLRPPNDR